MFILTNLPPYFLYFNHFTDCFNQQFDCLICTMIKIIKKMIQKTILILYNISKTNSQCITLPHYKGVPMTNRSFIPNNISTKLNEYFKERKMSQADVVKLCASKGIHISQSTIWNALAKPESMTLATLLKICDGLDIYLQDLISDEPLPTINNSNKSAFTLDSSDSAYAGYLGDYHIYFLPTTTSSNATHIHGNLSFTPDKHTNRCNATLNIETGEFINGNKIIKTYIGNLIISERQRCAYCTLISKSLGEICMFIFKHDYLNNNSLYCTMANAITSSAGKPRYPTVHRICLCRKELNEFALLCLIGELRMTDSKFFISAKNLRNFFNTQLNISSSFRDKISNIIEHSDNTYHMISESDFRNSIPNAEFIKNIARLKSYSEAPENLKITNETEDLLYTLLRSIQDNNSQN